MITKRWVIENGIGHWAIYLDNKLKATCDDSELNQVVSEVQMSKTIA